MAYYQIAQFLMTITLTGSLCRPYVFLIQLCSVILRHVYDNSNNRPSGASTQAGGWCEMHHVENWGDFLMIVMLLLVFITVVKIDFPWWFAFLRHNCQYISNQQYLISKIYYMRRNSVFASTMLQHYNLFCADNSWVLTCNLQATVQLYCPTAARHADKYDAAVSVYTAYRPNDSHWNARKYQIRKHPKIRCILRCKSPYFHHWFIIIYYYMNTFLVFWSTCAISL